ncbi:MAG: addiction module protein [Thermoguttaceae bacterium]
MTTQSQEVLQSALALPEEERAEIAASLIRSLDPKTDEDVDAAWADEIQRRAEAIDRGEVRLMPRDDVMQELRRRRHE